MYEKRQHYPPQPEDVAELEGLGYVITRLSSVHWRITKEEYRIKVDVWPTTRKLWIVSGGGSRTYESLYRSITGIFDRAPRG